MWKRFSNILRCPLCTGRLDLSVLEERDVVLEPHHLAMAQEQGIRDLDFSTYVESGLLTCQSCAISFPIFKGLPVLLPYTTTLHDEFVRQFGQNVSSQHASKFPNKEPVQGERFVLSSFSTEWLAYDFDGVIWEMDYADHERRFLAEMGPYRPSTVRPGTFLELGCGIGITTYLAQKNFGVDAVGVDLGLGAMRAAARYRDNPFLHFVQGSVFYLPFAHGSFDTIYSRGVLHHTYSTEEAFASLTRFSKPGGSAYLWVYGPRSTHDNPLRRLLFVAEKAVRKLLSGRDSGALANAVLYPIACAYVLFNHGRRLADRTIQPYNFRRALHAARDRFTPEFAHRHSDIEVTGWFKAADYVDLEVVDWRAMPSADHDDYRRNTGVRGRKAKLVAAVGAHPVA